MLLHEVCVTARNRLSTYLNKIYDKFVGRVRDSVMLASNYTHQYEHY